MHKSIFKTAVAVAAAALFCVGCIDNGVSVEEGIESGDGGGGGGGGGGGTSKGNAIPLTINQWANGNINAPGVEAWYSFTAVSGTAYAVWWNDGGYYAGDGSKTLDIRVRAYDSNGAELFEQDAAWSTAKTVNLISGGMVYLKVTAYNSSNTGTFAIGYSAGDRPNSGWAAPANTQLSANQWTNGSINSSSGQVWYSFYAAANTTYGVWWNDSYAGDGSKTLNASVRAYDSNGEILFDENTSFDMPSVINLYYGGMVYLRVTGYYSGSTGTFGILYGPGIVRPGVATTQLTMNQWINGSINTPGGVAWYSFYASAGTGYAVWWNDGGYYAGDGSKTLDIRVRAYNSNGAELFEQDAAWNTARAINLISGGYVYFRVTAYNNSNTGTFAITYSTDSERP